MGNKMRNLTVNSITKEGLRFLINPCQKGGVGS